MTHRLLSRSACRPCVHTNRSSGERPGRHSFHAPPGNGSNRPSAVASPTDGVGTSVQRGKLPKSRPRGDTAALVIMTLPDEATDISSMWPLRDERSPALHDSADRVQSLLGSSPLEGPGMGRSVRAPGKGQRFASRLVALGALVAIATALVSSSRIPENSADTAATRVRHAWAALPMSFEANLGQADPEVDFLSRGHDYVLFLTSQEAVFALRTPPARDAAVLRMRFVGANARPRVRGVGELPGRSSYFIGKDPQKWRSGVPTYARVEYRDVSPAVTLLSYGARQKSVEYDFVVAPGADPTAIALRFQGAERLDLEAD